MHNMLGITTILVFWTGAWSIKPELINDVKLCAQQCFSNGSCIGIKMDLKRPSCHLIINSNEKGLINALPKIQRTAVSRVPLLQCAETQRVLVVSRNQPQCVQDGPAGFRYWRGSCYLISNIEASFADAKNICEDMGGHLVIISSKSENNFIKNYLKQTGKAAYYWLGGSDDDVEGDWKWEGGSPVEYTDWARGQPNSFGGVENCLNMAKKFRYRWNDGHCNAKKTSFVRRFSDLSRQTSVYYGKIIYLILQYLMLHFY